MHHTKAIAVGRAIGFVGIAHIMIFENIEGAAFAKEVAVFTLCFFECTVLVSLN